MRKMTGMSIIALLAACLLCTAVGEAEMLSVPVSAAWTGVGNDSVTAESCPAWTDGTGYRVGQTAVTVHWTSPDGEGNEAGLILTQVKNDGGGALYDWRGRVAGEGTQDAAMSGKAAAALNENGLLSLTLYDTAVPELDGLCLVRSECLPPAADELKEEILGPVYGMETGTAGASLKQAGLCADLIRFAAEHHLFAVDENALDAAALEAAAGMGWTEEETAVFRENAAGVSYIMLTAARLTEFDGDGYTGTMRLMEDAGAKADLEGLLLRNADRYSVYLLAKVILMSPLTE